MKEQGNDIVELMQAFLKISIKTLVLLLLTFVVAFSSAMNRFLKKPQAPKGKTSSTGLVGANYAFADVPSGPLNDPGTPSDSSDDGGDCDDGDGDDDDDC